MFRYHFFKWSWPDLLRQVFFLFAVVVELLLRCILAFAFCFMMSFITASFSSADKGSSNIGDLLEGLLSLSSCPVLELVSTMSSRFGVGGANNPKPLADCVLREEIRVSALDMVTFFLGEGVENNLSFAYIIA